jgi:bifunctional non-homologous end joining protein LigD
VLWVDGERVTHRPLRDRKAILADPVLDGPAWREAPWQVGDVRALLAACEELGLEGVVAKRLDSIYRPGARTTLWRKKKCRAWLEEQLPRRIPLR